MPLPKENLTRPPARLVEGRRFDRSTEAGKLGMRLKASIARALRRFL